MSQLHRNHDIYSRLLPALNAALIGFSPCFCPGSSLTLYLALIRKVLHNYPMSRLAARSRDIFWIIIDARVRLLIFHELYTYNCIVLKIRFSVLYY